MDINGNRWHVAFQRFNVRRTGMTKRWKTRPTEFRIPVKFGLYESGEITHATHQAWHDGDWQNCQECEQREKETRKP